MDFKKVFLIRNVAPDKFGGAEIYQLIVARLLKAHGFSTAILTNSKELLSRAKQEGIKTFTPPYIKRQNWSGKYNSLLPLYAAKIKHQTTWYKNLFASEKPSIVNVQSRDDWLSATKAAKNQNITTFWTDHADFRNWALWNIDQKFKNPIGKLILKTSSSADKLIFISDYERSWFDSFLKTKPTDNLVIIKNGVLDRLKDYSSIKPEKQSFAFIGRLVDDKGMTELLAAFKTVAQTYPDATLNLYGDGDSKEYQTISENLPNIFFHGYTDDPLMALAKNEFFVLPSRHEGLSLSLLDAAMMQKPIIATAVGATSEVITHKKSGLLVRPESPKALARAMLEVLENRELSAQIAKNARKRYEAEFDFNRIFTEKMLPLYEGEK